MRRLYEAAREPVLRLLKAPTEPPEPPRGSHASVRVFRASPAYLRCRLALLALAVALVVLGALLLVIVGLVEREPGPIVPGALLLLAVPVLGAAQAFALNVDYDLRHYVVTDRSIRVREGAWVVKEETISHANVQNLRVVRGPLARLLGFATLEVDTAGGGAATKRGEGGGRTVRLAGIEEAAEVRDLVLGHLRSLGARAGGRDAGLGDPDDARGPRRAALPAGAADALREALAEAAALRAAAESLAR